MVIRRTILFLICISLISALGIIDARDPGDHDRDVNVEELFGKYKTPLYMLGIGLGTIWVGKAIHDYYNPDYAGVFANAQAEYKTLHAQCKGPINLVRTELKKQGIILEAACRNGDYDVDELNMLWNALDAQDEKKLATTAQAIWQQWPQIKKNILADDVSTQLKVGYGQLVTYTKWLRNKRHRSPQQAGMLVRMTQLAKRIDNLIVSLDGVCQYLRQYHDYFALYALEKKLSQKYAHRLRKQKKAKQQQKNARRTKDDTLFSDPSFGWDDEYEEIGHGRYRWYGARDVQKLEKLMNPCYPQLFKRAQQLCQQLCKEQ